MTRHPLIRILLVLPLVVLCGCADDALPPPSAPPGPPPTIAAVRVFPPRSVLRGAPEVLVIAGDSMRLDVDLGQDFMPGDDWGLEDTLGPGRFVTGRIAPRPQTPGMTITDAWIVLDDRVEGMRPSGWAGPGSRPPRFDPGIRSMHSMERLDTVDVVVRLRTAPGETRFLQRRRAYVMISE
ncbi:hypothetical protein [Longimicrobium sp.]|uniref:hypothetical protein n=1 Tax=Longimicrobium sp. TaxID=2029185 RepID=UPI002E34102A|nr:hypothetical protein [Longimicrobium sp.]HEX6039443.1 hypothetical protein [Longimicrobium sp.]